ncbi:MAG: hypothetical protein QGG69_07120, partial [Kiritimatiellia bacterium]|nr:hypothetical protein [Kiritimatiellia bacterium]
LKMPGHRAYGAHGGVVSARPSMVAVPVNRIEDPFTSVFLTAWLDLEASRKRERELAAARGTAAGSRTPSVPKPKPAPVVVQPAKLKWVRVIYQGMIARTDGKHVALVREVEGGRQHALAIGDVLEAGRVTDITAERIMLAVGQGEAAQETALRVGVVGRIRKDGP